MDSAGLMDTGCRANGIEDIHTRWARYKRRVRGGKKEKERRRIYGGESDPARVIIGQIAMRMDEL